MTRISPDAIEPRATADNPAVLEVIQASPLGEYERELIWHSTEQGVRCVHTVAGLREDETVYPPVWIAYMLDYQPGLRIESDDLDQVVEAIALMMTGTFGAGAVRPPEATADGDA